MRRALTLLALTALCACTTTTKPSNDLAAAFAGSELVDLTWPYDEHTLYWPTSPSAFELKQLAYGPTPGGWFYSSFAICTPEHGGTHLDAPIHFAEGKNTVDQIPLERLIAPAIVIDVADRAAANADYRLTAEDVRDWESRHGAIAAGTIILLRTGWGRRWPDRKSYFGDDTPGATDNLHFPSYGEDAVRLLVEQRRVAAIGVDTASIDYGQSRDFIVHRIANGADVPGLENIANLERLPARGTAHGAADENRGGLGRTGADCGGGTTIVDVVDFSGRSGQVHFVHLVHNVHRYSNLIGRTKWHV